LTLKWEKTKVNENGSKSSAVQNGDNYKKKFGRSVSERILEERNVLGSDGGRKAKGKELRKSWSQTRIKRWGGFEKKKSLRLKISANGGEPLKTDRENRLLETGCVK